MSLRWQGREGGQAGGQEGGVRHIYDQIYSNRLRRGSAFCSPAVAVNEMSFAVLTRLANVAYTQHAATQNGPPLKVFFNVACCACCYLFGLLFVCCLFACL